MVVVEGRRLIWQDKLVFFPSLSESQRLLENLQHNAIVRIRQMSDPLHKHPNLIRSSTFRTSCVDLTKDIGALYDEMDSMTQRYVRKAERMRERWNIRTNDLRCYEDFFQLYNSFVRLMGHTYPLSRQRLKEYLSVSDVWVIYSDERPIAGRLLVRDDTIKRVRMVLSPTSRLLGKEDAQLSGMLNRYLHWHELMTYKNRGMQLYDFGGVGDGSIARFKLSFGGFRVQDHSYVLAGALGVIAYKIYYSLLPYSVNLRNSVRRKKVVLP
jgi:hypothetical protein